MSCVFGRTGDYRTITKFGLGLFRVPYFCFEIAKLWVWACGWRWLYAREWSWDVSLALFLLSVRGRSSRLKTWIYSSWTISSPARTIRQTRHRSNKNKRVEETEQTPIVLHKAAYSTDTPLIPVKHPLAWKCSPDTLAPTGVSPRSKTSRRNPTAGPAVVVHTVLQMFGRRRFVPLPKPRSPGAFMERMSTTFFFRFLDFRPISSRTLFAEAVRERSAAGRPRLGNSGAC